MRISLLFFLLTLNATCQEEDLKTSIDQLTKRMDLMESSQLKTYWNQGFCFESPDGSSKGRISGKVHLETTFQNGDKGIRRFIRNSGQNLEDGIEFRRARIGFQGYVFDRYIYKTTFEFSGGDTDFKDVFVGVKDLPLDSVLKLGHFKEPFSLESVTSANGLMFHERSLVYSALTPARNTGLGLNGAALDQRMTWAMGLFYNTDDTGDGGEDGGLSATARLTCLPWRNQEDLLLHVGASYSRRGEDSLGFSARPEVQAAPDLIDTDGFVTQDPHLIPVNGANMYGAEALLLLGPLSTQAEMVRMDINSTGYDPQFSGYYLQCGYFIKGEQRQYQPALGRLSSTPSKSNAIEAAFRYSNADLNDWGVPNGGEVTDYTFGLNWYLNRSVSLSMNMVHSHLEDVGTARLLVCRFALTF